MQPMVFLRGLCLSACLGISLIASSIALGQEIAQDVWMIHYSDKPVTKKELSQLETLYGCRIKVLPFTGKPPKTPERLPGLVIMPDPASDRLWVQGDRNPALEYADSMAQLADRYEGEVKFLKEYAPEFWPTTILASDLKLSKGSGPKDFAKIKAQAEAIVGGPAILKLRDGFGSGGFLPKTFDNWEQMYRDYHGGTKQKIAELHRKLRDNDRVISEIEGIPGIEGVVLEQIFSNPENVLIQKLTPPGMEIRVHIYEGRVIDGASGVRFDKLGVVLTDETLKEAERALEERFLQRIPPKKRKAFSASMDVMISDNSRQIIDLNPGVFESGFYDIETDLHIVNLLVERLSGKPTPYLTDLRAFEQAKLASKPAFLKSLIAKYGEFVEGYEPTGFWDRIIKSYVREISESPSRKTLMTALEQLRAARLQSSESYVSFFDQVAAAHPEITLPAKDLKSWRTYLRRMDESLFVYTHQKTLRAFPIDDIEFSDEEASKLAAQKIRELENPEKLAAMTFNEAVEHLRRGTLSRFFTGDRISQEPPGEMFATKLRAGESSPIWIEEGSFQTFVRKALRKVGYYNKSRLTDFSKVRFRSGGRRGCDLLQGGSKGYPG